MVFCISVKYSSTRSKFFDQWLNTCTKIWGAPSSVRYCGSHDFESQVKTWAEMWFGCKYIPSETIEITVKTSPRVPSDNESILSPRSTSSDSDSPRPSSPSIVTPRGNSSRRLSRKNSKVSPRTLPSWVSEITSGVTHVLIFSESDLSDGIMKHVAQRPCVAINIRHILL